MSVGKYERQDWCPHADCKFCMQAGGVMCVGHLPAPVPHDEGMNNYRMCLAGAADDGGVFDLQICDGDIQTFRQLFAALQEK